MKENRPTRGNRDRKAHLSADAERLLTISLGLANSGSRVEDRFWDAELSGKLQKLLDSGHTQALYDALDRLHQTDLEAYGALVEAVEENAEALVIELDGQRWQVLLVAAPVVAWTRFNIPAGPIESELCDSLAAIWQEHVLMSGVKFSLRPCLYSVDQLPRDYAELRRLTLSLGSAALGIADPGNKPGKLPESALMLADARFLVGAAVAPVGAPLFRWQATDLRRQGGRIKALERWVESARPIVEQMMPGCGFECLLPDAYHLNMRESDRRVRPFGVLAAVHFLTHALKVEPAKIHATIAAFGNERVDEYRIGLAVDGAGEDIAHGIVWPLLGPETDEDDPSPLARIRQRLEESGVTKIAVWPSLTEPEFCEDCGAPLYPNTRSELIHAELPSDIAPESVHFH